MENIENLIVEFVRDIGIGSYIAIIFCLLWLPLFAVLIIRDSKYKIDKEEKLEKSDIYYLFLGLILCFSIYIIGNIAAITNYFTLKNTSIADLNNRNNIFLQEKNNNIEVYYVPKIHDIKTDENILERAELKITVQQIGEENYYIYFDYEKNQKKEVKKEDLKDFIQNIKKQENYKGTGKTEKLTLEDFK